MKLVQAREWADIYLSSPHMKNEAGIGAVKDMLIDAYTAGWREGWEDGELCGYNRGREHNETDLEVGRNAGIQEGIERMQKAYQIRPRGKSIFSSCPECSLVEGKHKLDCSYGRYDD